MSRVAQLVSDRLLTLPDCLRSLLVQCDPAGHSARPAVRPLTAKDAPIWVTGGGMSEGPAHYLVALLSAQGIAATFVPLSEFVSESLPQPGDDRAGSWHAAAGLPAGVVQALATNPLSAGVVYVGGEFAGLYRSVNGGQTWDSPVLSGLTIRAIAANRRTPGVIYAGASSGGIYRSPDGGSTWQAYEANLGLLPIKALLWDGGSCSAVLAGTTNGVWRRGD